MGRCPPIAQAGPSLLPSLCLLEAASAKHLSQDQSQGLPNWTPMVVPQTQEVSGAFSLKCIQALSCPRLKRSVASVPGATANPCRASPSSCTPLPILLTFSCSPKSQGSLSPDPQSTPTCPPHGHPPPEQCPWRSIHSPFRALRHSPHSSPRDTVLAVYLVACLQPSPHPVPPKEPCLSCSPLHP